MSDLRTGQPSHVGSSPCGTARVDSGLGSCVRATRRSTRKHHGCQDVRPVLGCARRSLRRCTARFMRRAVTGRRGNRRDVPLVGVRPLGVPTGSSGVSRTDGARYRRLSEIHKVGHSIGLGTSMATARSPGAPLYQLDPSALAALTFLPAEVREESVWWWVVSDTVKTAAGVPE